MEKKSDMMNTRLKVENENGIRGGEIKKWVTATSGNYSHR